MQAGTADAEPDTPRSSAKSKMAECSLFRFQQRGNNIYFHFFLILLTLVFWNGKQRKFCCDWFKILCSQGAPGTADAEPDVSPGLEIEIFQNQFAGCSFFTA